MQDMNKSQMSLILILVLRYNMTEVVTLNREYISKMLHENICEVTFTKVNGEKRVMPCTLKDGVVPIIEHKEGSEPKKPNLDILSVYCLDKKEWRSFRVANVTDVKVVE